MAGCCAIGDPEGNLGLKVEAASEQAASLPDALGCKAATQKADIKEKKEASWHHDSARPLEEVTRVGEKLTGAASLFKIPKLHKSTVPLNS